MLVSLVIPVYNEISTLAELLRRCIAVDYPKELVIVDDCSRDGSREFLEELSREGLGLLGGAPENRNELRVLFQPENQGKGAALRRGADGLSVVHATDAAPTEFDIDGIMVHEVGHVIGIGHSNVSGATMYPSISACNTSARTLASDDIAARDDLY